MRKTLTTKAARALKARAKPYVFSDPELRQHYVRVSPTGRKSFAVITYTTAGKQKWVTIGDVDIIEIDEARNRAREIILRISDGLPAVEAAPDSFEAVAQDWLKRHVVKNGLRTEKTIRRRLLKHPIPFWKDRTFLSIKRSDVAAFLDHVEDNHGAAEASNQLSLLSAMMNWFARRNDDYRPPLIRGMHRYSTKEHARTRILDDAEIRELWQATGSSGTYGNLGYNNFVRLALLTAQRHAKVNSIKWDDITDEGEWIIRREPREKNNAGSLLLPKLALDVIKAQPRFGENPHVFAGRMVGSCLRLHSAHGKHAIDAKMHNVKPWRIHDLRRTARSLMSRAGVRPEIAERVLGHTIRGVEGTYDRHSYRDEKRDALQRLANLISSIVDPQENVVPLVAKQK